MRRFILIIGAVLLVLGVAGAAFVGARMLNTPDEKSGSGANRLIMSGPGGGKAAVAIDLDIKPAPELPQRAPEVRGLFERREDNSIFVGTGEIQFMVKMDQATGQTTSSSNYDGPVLEVVVTRDTALYLDITKMPSPGATSGTQSIQQTVKPVDSLDDLSKNTQIQVWGSRSGDRVVAEVLVYRSMGK